VARKLGTSTNLIQYSNKVLQENWGISSKNVQLEISQFHTTFNTISMATIVHISMASGLLREATRSPIAIG